MSEKLKRISDEAREAAERIVTLFEEGKSAAGLDLIVARAYLRELAERREGGWQDVETAPYSEPGKYQNYILLWNGHHRVGFRQKNRHGFDDDDYSEPEFWDKGGDTIEPQPTHWMPLPPHPGDGDGGKEKHMSTQPKE